MTFLPFFPTRKMVARYNDMVLQNTMEQKITITAIDIPPNDNSPKFREQLHTAIDKQKAESTGGLPKQITIALNHQYDIISNISVEDGLMNGAQCCVKVHSTTGQQFRFSCHNMGEV